MSTPLFIQQADGSLVHLPAARRAWTLSPILLAAILIAAHVPLALAMRQFPILSTIHALATMGLGLWWAISENKILHVACLGGYLTGAEVLWRMTKAQVPWEFGKYAVGMVFILALLRNRRMRMPLLPFIYFVLLLPGIVPTAMNFYFSFESLRQMISSNMSGPFALMVCAWFFTNVRLTSSQVETVFLSVIGPTVGIAVITLFSTLTAEDLEWGSHSNFVSSGGFGPNQVSGALGLGALLALLLLLRTRASLPFKIFLFVIMSFLTVQSALTFSRGGLVGAAAAALVTVIFLMRRPHTRKRLLIVIGVILLTALVVFPAIDRITGGALSARFENTSTTGRTEIAESELQMWDKNFVFGVGVGMSFYRDTGWSLTHTEFTRMLAEHGLFGLLAIVLLITAGARRLWACPDTENKAVIAAFWAWSFLFMLDKAMRLAAPCFMYGLTFATLELDQQRQAGVAYRIVNTRRSPEILPIS